MGCLVPTGPERVEQREDRRAHGGEASSVAFRHDLGMGYVNCSPFRVPVARLAAAQAALRSR